MAAAIAKADNEAKKKKKKNEKEKRDKNPNPAKFFTPANGIRVVFPSDKPMNIRIEKRGIMSAYLQMSVIMLIIYNGITMVQCKDCSSYCI